VAAVDPLRPGVVVVTTDLLALRVLGVQVGRAVVPHRVRADPAAPGSSQDHENGVVRIECGVHALVDAATESSARVTLSRRVVLAADVPKARVASERTLRSNGR